MTDDLGPGEELTADLSTIFDAYRIPAAGLAAERDDDLAAELLNGTSMVAATFADFPVTASGGRSMASVDVNLRVPPELADQVTDATPNVIAGLLNEVVEPDGYRVGHVRITPDSEPFP
jgi:hypothetical protein